MGERDALQKYEALYAEAREMLCSCNLTDTPEKGESYNYTCEWCKDHPDGAEPPEVIKRMFLAEEQLGAANALAEKLAEGLRDTLESCRKDDSRRTFRGMQCQNQTCF